MEDTNSVEATVPIETKLARVPCDDPFSGDFYYQYKLGPRPLLPSGKSLNPTSNVYEFLTLAQQEGVPHLMERADVVFMVEVANTIGEITSLLDPDDKMLNWIPNPFDEIGMHLAKRAEKIRDDPSTEPTVGNLLVYLTKELRIDARELEKLAKYGSNPRRFCIELLRTMVKTNDEFIFVRTNTSKIIQMRQTADGNYIFILSTDGSPTTLAYVDNTGKNPLIQGIIIPQKGVIPTYDEREIGISVHMMTQRDQKIVHNAEKRARSFLRDFDKTSLAGMIAVERRKSERDLIGMQPAKPGESDLRFIPREDFLNLEPNTIDPAVAEAIFMLNPEFEYDTVMEGTPFDRAFVEWWEEGEPFTITNLLVKLRDQLMISHGRKLPAYLISNESMDEKDPFQKLLSHFAFPPSDSYHDVYVVPHVLIPHGYIFVLEFITDTQDALQRGVLRLGVGKYNEGTGSPIIRRGDFAPLDEHLGSTFANEMARLAFFYAGGGPKDIYVLNDPDRTRRIGNHVRRFLLVSPEMGRDLDPHKRSETALANSFRRLIPR